VGKVFESLGEVVDGQMRVNVHRQFWVGVSGQFLRHLDAASRLHNSRDERVPKTVEVEVGSVFHSGRFEILPDSGRNLEPIQDENGFFGCLPR
jgi:hypothetical protein